MLESKPFRAKVQYIFVIDRLNGQISETAEKIQQYKRKPQTNTADKLLPLYERIHQKLTQIANLEAKLMEDALCYIQNIGSDINDALEKAVERTAEVNCVMSAWGTDSGEMKNTPANKELLEYVKKSEELLRIARSLGKYRELITDKRKNGFAYDRGEKYDLTLGSGMGTFQIALTLSDEKILTPTEYTARKGIKKAGGNTGKTTADPYRWGQSTVGKILATQEYCGDVINFKTYSISYKNKKRHANDPENILVFKEVHEPIIDRTIFETIQLRRGKTRKRPMSNGEKNMFSGLLVCSDCGRNLHYHLNNRNIRFFSCPGYNQGRRKECTATHYVRVDFLEQVVLAEIRRLTRFACKYEDEFVRVASQFSKQAMQSQIDAYQSEVRSLMSRDKELDRIFERLYEDNLSGKITDERFKKMSVNYDDEQKDLRERLNRLNDILEELACKTNSTEKFIKAVKKYTRVKKLTASMVTELIEHIGVHHTEKIDGVKTQKLVIYYNCIGSINIPDDVSIPEVDITMKTRKGVELTYVPDAAPVASAV